MSSSIDQLHKAFVHYQSVLAESTEALQKSAEYAEENDDYEDYDQDCYDHWEPMTYEGQLLAAAVEKFLNIKIPE